MRRPLIAGNWKMNKTPSEAGMYARELRRELAGVSSCDILIIPPFPSIVTVREALGKGNILLGAQNIFHEKRGAFTGEVSAEMLLDAGCSHVLAGHSERRKILHESDESINRKVIAAIKGGLIPILCIGETIEERERGDTFDVVAAQLDADLKGLSPQEATRMAIAYEPVWAIGTGRNATPQEAGEVHSFIRDYLERRFQPYVARQMRILYGGSVTSSNIDSLMEARDVDGALVGGASLKLTEFVRIVNFRRGLKVHI